MTSHTNETEIIAKPAFKVGEKFKSAGGKEWSIAAIQVNSNIARLLYGSAFAYIVIDEHGIQRDSLVHEYAILNTTRKDIDGSGLKEFEEEGSREN